MTRKVRKTIGIALSGLLVLASSTVNGADSPKRLSSVQHEMVPHVVLPETIQYNKSAKRLPSGDFGNVSPYVATYTPFPSYQVPYSAEFRSVGQSVYPVSPKLLPAPETKAGEEKQNTSEPAEFETAVTEQFNDNGRDIVLNKPVKLILLAADNQELIPVLPEPGGIEQTGMFYQHPTKPPAAWSFSSPLFKVASVPSGWGNGQGFVSQNGLNGCQQQLAFQPAGTTTPIQMPGNAQQSAADGSQQQGGNPNVPYSTFQFGLGGFRDRQGQAASQPSVFTLPNGMLLVTLPSEQRGFLRCRSDAPKTVILPAAASFGGSPVPTAMPLPAASQGSMFMPGLNGTMPQMQMVPVTAMTAAGPVIVGYQQTALPMPNNFVNPMFNPSAAMIAPTAYQPPILQTQLATASVNAKAAANKNEQEQSDGKDENSLTALLPANGGQIQTLPQGLIVTPYGLVATGVPAGQGGAAQGSAAQQIQSFMQTPLATQNPYAGYYVTPYGMVALNPQQGMVNNAGFANFGGMPPQMSSQSLTVADLVYVLSQMNNKQNRRARLFDRIAERREERRKGKDGSDPIAQLCQAWATPYVSADTSLRMPSRNAYPYGYFGVQASPISTANYGGYHNLSFGNTTYPGLY